MSSQPKRVLLIKHGSLGDIFLILGAIKDLAQFAGAKIDVLTAAPYAKIFQRSPDVACVHVDNRQSLLNIRYLLSIRSKLLLGDYDLIVDFQNSSRTVFYQKWLAPNIRWCQLGRISPSEFISNETSSSVLAKFQHQLHSSGIKFNNLIAGDLNWLCDSSNASKTVKKSAKSIVLLPGASPRHKYKIWPYYNELARDMIGMGLRVFIAPGPDDMEQCMALEGELLLNEGRWLNFFQLAGVLKEADFVVGNDSGPTHLAASLGTKGVALFGNRTAKYADNMHRQNMSVLVSNELEDISTTLVTSELLRLTDI